MTFSRRPPADWRKEHQVWFAKQGRKGPALIQIIDPADPIPTILVPAINPDIEHLLAVGKNGFPPKARADQASQLVMDAIMGHATGNPMGVARQYQFGTEPVKVIALMDAYNYLAEEVSVTPEGYGVVYPQELSADLRNAYLVQQFASELQTPTISPNNFEL